MTEFSFYGWLENGVKGTFTVTTTDDPYGEVLLLTNTLLSRGFSLTEPGLGEGESGDIIKTVMRRAKSDGTPIIDFYTDWGKATKGKATKGKEAWGTFKYLHVYMNADQPEMIAEFLAASGFKSLDDIPLYDGQNPLKRTEDKKHAKETTVPTPFKVIKAQGDERMDSDGKPYRPWLLVRFESTDGKTISVDSSAIAPQAPNAASMATSSIDDKDTTWVTRQDAVTAFCSAVVTYFAQQRIKVTAADIFGAINIVTQQSAARFGEFVNTTQADAWASVLLQMANHNKANALAQVKGDPILTKAINFWVAAVEDINF